MLLCFRPSTTPPDGLRLTNGHEPNQFPVFFFFFGGGTHKLKHPRNADTIKMNCQKRRYNVYIYNILYMSTFFFALIRDSSPAILYLISVVGYSWIFVNRFVFLCLGIGLGGPGFPKENLSFKSDQQKFTPPKTNECPHKKGAISKNSSSNHYSSGSTC